jgi:hypothetical protein
MREHPFDFLNRASVAAPELSDEVGHFYLCPLCGQAVDMRRLGDIFYHEEDGHVPHSRN